MRSAGAAAGPDVPPIDGAPQAEEQRGEGGASGHLLLFDIDDSGSIDLEDGLHGRPERRCGGCFGRVNGYFALNKRRSTATFWHIVGLLHHHIVGPTVKFCRLCILKLPHVEMHPMVRRAVYVALMGSLVFWFYFNNYLRSSDDTLQLIWDDSLIRATYQQLLEGANFNSTADHFDQMPHHAGTQAGLATARYVFDTFNALGLEGVTLDERDVFLTHARAPARVTIFDSLGGKQREIILDEAPSKETPLPSQQQPIPQMALAMSGSGRGRVIYANYGRHADLRFLEKCGISLKETVVIIRYGHGDASLKAKKAQDAGARAVLFFSEKHGPEDPWPHGREYAETAVERGSLGLPALYPGDLLSPGWSSSSGQKLSDVHKAQNVVHIPVAPMSWRDAKLILDLVAGKGQRVDDWHNNGEPAIGEWWTGDETSPEIQVDVSATEESRQPLFNVMGRIVGAEDPGRAVVLGAQLDSFCYGGSALSGLNVLLHTATALAQLRYEKKWQPLRSVYFMAFDGSEHNLAGSTEWIEAVSEYVVDSCVLYIDLEGVAGDEFLPRGHPAVQLEDILTNVSVSNETLRDSVAAAAPAAAFKPIQDFGNSLGFAAHCGVPSVALGFRGPHPGRSCFDTLEWMQQYGDPGFERHRALAAVGGSLAIKYSTVPILPYRVTAFGERLKEYIDDLERYAEQELSDAVARALPFALLWDGARLMLQAGHIVDDWVANWVAMTQDLPSGLEIPILRKLRQIWNDRLALSAKLLLDMNGLPQRNWYKNQVFGPQFDRPDDDAAAALSGVFPGVRDAVHARRPDLALVALKRAADALKRAASVLLEGISY